jgi:hypothetical protein
MMTLSQLTELLGWAAVFNIAYLYPGHIYCCFHKRLYKLSS